MTDLVSLRSNPKHSAWGDPRAEWIAQQEYRGELPPAAERTCLQRAAVDAYLDGACEDYSYVLAKRVRCGNGHTEGLAVRVDVKGGAAMWDRLFLPRKSRGEGDRDSSAARAARRAKKEVRLACKSLGVTALGTLTYQENMTDRDRLWRDFKAFIRHVRRVLPHFDYVAVPEPQDRGAWHMHFGMRRLPHKVMHRGQLVKSWDWMRAIWRRTIGGGGNFDEQKKLGAGSYARVMKIAHYVSKYVAKDFAAGPLNRRRYAVSDGHRAAVETRRFDAGELLGAVQWVYGAIEGHMSDSSSWHSEARGLYWISAYTGEPPGVPVPA